MIQLEDFFTYWQGTPNQKKAVEILQKAMPIELLQDSSEWVLQYRTADAPAAHASGIPPQGIALCHEFEGCVLHPYNDGVGVATIGWGNTFYADGRKVSMSDPDISQAEADHIFDVIADKNFWSVIQNTIPYWGEMNDNQRSALFSFSYNLGAYFYGSSGFNTISRVLKEKDWDKVPDAFDLYCNPGSSVEAGLRRRRAAEGDLWCKPM